MSRSRFPISRERVSLRPELFVGRPAARPYKERATVIELGVALTVLLVLAINLIR